MRRSAIFKSGGLLSSRALLSSKRDVLPSNDFAATLSDPPRYLYFLNLIERPSDKMKKKRHEVVVGLLYAHDNDITYFIYTDRSLTLFPDL